jgi:hypothetical protein
MQGGGGFINYLRKYVVAIIINLEERRSQKKKGGGEYSRAHFRCRRQSEPRRANNLGKRKVNYRNAEYRSRPCCCHAICIMYARLFLLASYIIYVGYHYFFGD